MRFSKPAILAFMSIVLVASYATSSSAAPSDRAIETDSRTNLLDAESAAMRSDWSLTATLAQRSYVQRPDVLNEFDLATAYQHTGQGALAVPLYIDLIDRGRFTRTVALQNADGSWPTPMLLLVSDEAASRLANMGVDAGNHAASGAYPSLASK